MSDERPTTSSASMFPAYLSSALAYLLPVLPSRLASGLASTSKPATQRRAAHKRDTSDAAKTEQPPATPSSKENFCRDALAHEQQSDRMGFGERLKSVFRSIVPSKE